jgi:hypothetical protein
MAQASESEDFEYAYSSAEDEEDDYPADDDEDDNGMDWNAAAGSSSDNPNAAPMHFKGTFHKCNLECEARTVHAFAAI